MIRLTACLIALALAGPAWAGAEDLLGSKEAFLKPRLGARLPKGLAFTDSTGRRVALGDYGKDRPFILVLAYYRCPMLCTLVLNDLVSSLGSKAMPFHAGREFEVVVISFDPTEKPELAAAKKKAYVEEYVGFGKSPEMSEAGWHFLTGDRPDIDRLMDATGFHAVWDERQKQYAHGRAIMIVSPNLLLTLRCFQDGWYPPRDLKMALIESSEGKVGSPMDRVLLMCFNYDPVTGSYSVAVLRLVQLGGLLTVAGIGLFWWWPRRDLTPPRPPLRFGEGGAFPVEGG